jgi:hypothetical protein
MKGNPQDPTPKPGNKAEDPILFDPDDCPRATGPTPISKGNFSRYRVIARTDLFTCSVGPFGSFGHVFLNVDILAPPVLGMEPVMVIDLPPGEVTQYQQLQQAKSYRDYPAIEVGRIWLTGYLETHGGVEFRLWELAEQPNIWELVKGLVGQGSLLTLYRTGTHQDGTLVTVDQIATMLESAPKRPDPRVLLLRTQTAPERLIKRQTRYLP